MREARGDGYTPKDGGAYVWPSPSSAIASGGDGVAYQNHVGAILLSHLVTGQPFTRLFDVGRITRVSFQQRLQDWMLDDVVLEVRFSDNVIERAAIQITRDLSFIPSDEKYKAILGASWHTMLHQKPAFYGFISRAATDSLRRLTESAFTREDDAEDWWREVNLANNLSAEVQRELKNLVTTLKAVISDHHTPTAAELVQFLNHFKPMTLRVGSEGDDEYLVARLALQTSGIPEADQVVDALRDAAERGATHRHRFNQETLRRWVTQHRGPWLHETLSGSRGDMPGEIATHEVLEASVRVGTVDRALLRQTEAFGLELRESTIQDIADGELALRHGDFEGARKAVTRARRPAVWDALTDEDRARVELLDGRVSIGLESDINRARAHLATATSYFPSPANDKFDIQLLLESGDFASADARLKDLRSREPELPFVWQLSAIVALLQDDVQSAEDALSVQGVPRDAEFQRLLALIALRKGERAAAVAAVETGLEQDPKNVALLRLHPVTLFNAALLDGTPAVMSTTPPPIPRLYVRSDENARESARQASEMFARFVETVQAETDKQHLRVWLVAAFAIQDRLAEAQVTLNDVFATGATEPDAIGWATLYHLQFDRDIAITNLSGMVPIGHMDVPRIQALATLLIDQHQESEAQEILRRFQRRFEEEGAGQIYRALLSETGGTPEVGESEDDIEAEHLRLVRDAERSDDWGPLADYARKRYERTGSVMDLLSLAVALHRARRWSELAQFSETLLKTKSAVAASYVLQALYNAEQFDTFVKSYREQKSLLTTSIIDPQILPAYASSLERLGRFREAAVAWNEVRTRDQGSDWALASSALVRIYAALGDVNGLREVGEALLRVPPSTEGLLAASEMAQSTARDIAIRLWRKATLQLPENLVPTALMLAFRLGLDTDPQVEALTKRMTALGQRGDSGVTQVSLEDVKRFRQEKIDTVEQMYLLYRASDVPIHLLADGLGRPISEFWSEAFFGFREIFSRYAARVDDARLPPEQEGTERRYGLDITSILTLHHLDLLEMVLDSANVVFPAETLNLLARMRNAAGPPQPVVSGRNKRLRDRLTDGSIEVISGEAPPGALTIRSTEGREGIARLVNAMAQTGVITASPAEALRRVGPYREYDAGEIVLPEHIHLDAGSALLLEDLGFMGALARRRAVSVDSDTLRFIEHQTNLDDYRTRRQQELDVLHDLLSSRSEGRTLPFATGVERDATINTVLSLLQHLNGPSDVLIVDDRSITKHVRTDRNALIATTFELLEAIPTIAPARRAAAHQELRRRRFFFLAVSEQEIIEALRAALVDKDGNVIETERLEEHRHYVAEIVDRRDVLQTQAKAAGTAFPLGEGPYYIRISGTIGDALVRVWSDPQLSRLQKRAYGDWLAENMLIDDLPAVNAMRVFGAPRSEVDIAAAGVTMLLFRGYPLMADRQLGPDYIEFIMSRFVRFRMQLDPDVLPVIGSQMVDLFRAAMLSAGDSKGVTNALIHRFFNALPAAIQGAVQHSGDVSDVLHFTTVKTVDIRGVRFDSERLWAAVARAWDGAEETVESLGPIKSWTVTRRDAGITLRSGDDELPIFDTSLKALNLGIKEKRDFLDHTKGWFDGSTEEREKAIAHVLSASSPGDFMQRMSEISSADIGTRTRNLAWFAAREGHLVVEEALPSDAAVITRYLRLPRTFRDPTAYDEAAAKLIEDVGLEEALRRFFLIPVNLSKRFNEEWRRQKHSERIRIYRALAATVHGPLDYAHLRHLASFGDISSRVRASGTLEDGLLAACDRNIAASYLSVVGWTHRALQLQERVADPGPLLVMAWIFGSSYYRHLRRAGVDPAVIGEAFGELEQRTNRRLFADVRVDAASPDHGVSDFIARVFAYAYSKVEKPIGKKRAAAWTRLLASSAGKVFPRLDVRPFPADSDFPGTFLTADIRPVLPIALPSVAKAYEDDTRSELLAWAESTAETSPSNVSSWAILPTLSDLYRASTLERLRGAIENFDVVAAFQSTEGLQATRFMLNVPGILADETFREVIVTKILETASSLGQPQVDVRYGDELSENQVEGMHQAILRLANASVSDERDRAEVYVRMSHDVAYRWPNYLRKLSPVIVELTKTLPLVEAVPLGPLVIHARRL